VLSDFHYDEFGFVEEPAPPQEIFEQEPHVPIREQFPEAGSAHLGGTSDGWEYRTVFGGSKLANTYNMVRQFLTDEGYGDIPLPANADELKLFRRPRNPQLQLFGERGYIHNPIKILFSNDPKQRSTLIVCLYNEKTENHLLRFHGVLAVSKLSN
jgi:hypothetical protein